MPKIKPAILSFSGHDPSGGAGIQADIETQTSLQCHSCSIITSLTDQDSFNIKNLIPQQSQDIIDQATSILNDFPIKVFKIGLIGSHEIALAIHSILLKYPTIPVILDPILAAGGGTSLTNEQLINTIITKLLPCTTILTPNSVEARRLTSLQDLMACGQQLVNLGCDYVLITGAHEQSSTVKNQLFQAQGKTESFNWDRLEGEYHGSGCTLASAIAALIAQGLDPFTAISEAQEYTWNTLAAGYPAGKGQLNPDRFFWMETT